MSSFDVFLPPGRANLDGRLVAGVATAGMPERSGEIRDDALTDLQQ